MPARRSFHRHSARWAAAFPSNGFLRSIIEVKDEKIEERFSDAEKARAVALEGERIARYLKDNEIIAALKITGRQLTSPDFAKKIDPRCVSAPLPRPFHLWAAACGKGSEEDKRSPSRLRPRRALW